MPPPTFGTRTIPDPHNSNSNSQQQQVPIPKPVQVLLKELALRLRTLLVTPSEDLSPCIVTINHILAEPSLQQQSQLRGSREGNENGINSNGNASGGKGNEAGGNGGSGKGGEGGGSSTSKESTSTLRSQVSSRINNELMKIFSDEMDQSDLDKLTFLITILRQLSSLLGPSCIIMEWWDLVLRPILKNPLASSVSAARARQLVTLSMASTPSSIYKDEPPPVASWPNSLMMDSLKKGKRKQGDAPYPTSSTSPIRSKTSVSSNGSSSHPGLSSEGSKVQRLNMYFRFTQRIFDLYLSEAVVTSSRNQADDDVADLREEAEGNAKESQVEDELARKKEEEAASQEPFKEDTSGPMDLVGTTWKGNLEAILLTYGQEKPTEFFHHLADSFSEPSSRVPLILLLTIFLRLYSNHAYRITSTRLPVLIVLSLQLDTSKTLTSLALTAMVILLPHIPNWIASGGAGGLPVLLGIFARVVDWRRLGPGWEDRVGDGDDLDRKRREHDEEFGEMERIGRRLNIRKGIEWRRLQSTFDTTPTAPPDASQFFTLLYGLFPCNMIRFLRAPIDYLRKANYDDDSPFEGDWEDLMDEASIQARCAPILRRHILHPALIQLSAESEICDKMRWMQHDAADITAECSSLFLGSWHRPIEDNEGSSRINQFSTPRNGYLSTPTSTAETSMRHKRERIGSDEMSFDHSASPRGARVGGGAKGHFHQRSVSSQFSQASEGPHESHRPSNSMAPFRGVRPTVDADEILSTYATLRSGAPLPPLGAAAIASTSMGTSFPPPPIFGHQPSDASGTQTRMSRSSTWGSLPPIQSGVLTSAGVQQQFLANLPQVRSGLAAPVMTASSSSSGGISNRTNLDVSVSSPPSPTIGGETIGPRRSRNRSGSLSSAMSLLSNQTSTQSHPIQYANVTPSTFTSAPALAAPPKNHFIHPLSASASQSNVLNHGSPVLSTYAHSNVTASPQLRPARSEVYTELSYLQRENLLLRNELNFELYLKEQHLRHIGRLHRDRISDTALEAERQNLYQSVRSLRAQLSAALTSQERQRAEATRTTARQVSWTNELNAKLKVFRDEKKSWTNEARESRAKLETAEGIIKDQTNRLQELGANLFEIETELKESQPKILKIKNYEDKISQLSTCLSYWDDDVRKYEEQRKEMEILLNRWKEMEMMLVSSENGLKIEVSRKEISERKIDRLENELRLAGNKIAELSKSQARKKAAEDQHSKLEERKNLGDERKFQQENLELRATIEKLSTQLQDKSSRVDSLEAEKAYQSARIRLLNQDKEQSRLHDLIDRNSVTVSAPGSSRMAASGPPVGIAEEEIVPLNLPTPLTGGDERLDPGDEMKVDESPGEQEG